MRTAAAAAALLLALAGPALADLPPPPARERPQPKKPAPPKEGQGALKLTAGSFRKLDLPGGTQLVCDDPSVAAPEVVDEALGLRALKPGATTCAARFAGAQRGTWTVTVEAAK